MAGRPVRVVLTVLCCAPFAVPLVLMIAASLRSPEAPLPAGFEVLPPWPSLDAYREALTVVPLSHALGQSLWICAVAVPVSVVTSSWAGLTLALSRGTARAVLVAVTLLLLVIPATASWLTRFTLFRALGVIGTPFPVIAPALMGGAPLFVLLFADAFRRLPRPVLDAARVEGASVLQVWWKVALPMAKPTTVAVSLLSFALFWTGFIDPLLYLHEEEALTAPLMLQHLELLGSTRWPVLMAASVMVTLPAMVAFAFASRGLFEERRGTGWLG